MACVLPLLTYKYERLSELQSQAKKKDGSTKIAKLCKACRVRRLSVFDTSGCRKSKASSMKKDPLTIHRPISNISFSQTELFAKMPLRPYWSCFISRVNGEAASDEKQRCKDNEKKHVAEASESFYKKTDREFIFPSVFFFPCEGKCFFCLEHQALGRASRTMMLRPSSSASCSSSIIFSASALSGISTKAKPLERPVSRSLMILQESTRPYSSTID